jgi:hypothetical protein
MEKQFWTSIMENNFAFPAGHSIPALTDELFSYIGSTDAELRDSIGLEVFYNWLKQGLYSVDNLRDIIARLIPNLQKGIGETEGDFVFLRSFSALWLALIVDNNNETLELEREDIAPILEAALAHFAGESDLRGYVPLKGYAHATAHASDLLGALGHSLHIDANDHIKILNCIASKLSNATQGIYLYNEDSRIARTVTRIFVRNTLTMKQISDWLSSLSNGWHGAWQNEELTRAYNNGRNFLRSLYLYILMLEGDKIPYEEKILKLLQDTLGQAKPWDWSID